MVRQYGLGYIFVDQSASLLSKVAFANSYATLALSQKLRSDIQAIAGAMNLTEAQRDALSTLPIGSAVVRLADEHPEPFLVKIPRCAIQEGCISDAQIQARWRGCSGDTGSNKTQPGQAKGVSPVPVSDNNSEITGKNENSLSHPPSPRESEDQIDTSSASQPKPPGKQMSREEIRFLADVSTRPLSTTVSRYQRLHLSRRRGNAIRQQLAAAGIIEAVTIATRSGQVVLYELTEFGRAACHYAGIDPGPKPRESLEHRFWVNRAVGYFEKQGYDMIREHPVKGNGAIDLLAQRPGEKVAVEVETGKSDIAANLKKIQDAGFDRIVLVATSPAAVSACQKAVSSTDRTETPAVEQLTWLDIS